MRRAHANAFGGATTTANYATTTANNTAISDALDQIINAATNDNSLLATMVAQLAALLTRLDTMQQPSGGTTPATTTSTTPLANTTTPTPPTTTAQMRQPREVYTQADALSRFDPTGYCSAHGYRVVASHTSKICKFRGPHHNENATREDTKNGCKRYKGWETNPNPM